MYPSPIKHNPMRAHPHTYTTAYTRAQTQACCCLTRIRACAQTAECRQQQGGLHVQRRQVVPRRGRHTTTLQPEALAPAFTEGGHKG